MNKDDCGFVCLAEGVSVDLKVDGFNMGSGERTGVLVVVR